MPVSENDVIIAGGGAAGLCAGLFAVQKGLKPLILEAGALPGRKLAICGGGYANFSNRCMGRAHYFCQPDQHFCENALRKFTPDDCVRLMEQAGLPWEEREKGRLFLRVPASALTDWLISEIQAAGGRIKTSAPVEKVHRDKGAFTAYSGCRSWRSARLLLAVGSPARPALAGKGDIWEIAASLGHKIIPPRPALTPLLFAPGGADALLFTPLSGISVPCAVCLYNNGPRICHDDLLFTQSGLSGPAILRLSLFAEKEITLTVNFLPAHNFEALLDEKANSASTALRLAKKLLPDRLAETLLKGTSSMKKIAELSRAERRHIAASINARVFRDLALAGFSKAEVCSGGVSVDELLPSSMESRIAPGLRIIGEMCAVTGELGGYNLHWAFASAFCAMENIK